MPIIHPTPSVTPVHNYQGQPPADPTDWASVTNRIRNGDTAAEAELYSVFSRGIRYSIARQLGPDGIEDKVHDCFLIAIQAIKQDKYASQSDSWDSFGPLYSVKSGRAFKCASRRGTRLCANDVTVVDRAAHNKVTPEHEYRAKHRVQLARAEVAQASRARTGDPEALLSRRSIEGTNLY